MLEMLQYLGVKLLLASAMKKGEFEETYHPINGCKYGSDAEGYLVEYEDGYKAWSPKAAFEKAYRRTEGMNFGLAIEALKMGKRVARAGWNGKGMWLKSIPSVSLPAYNRHQEHGVTFTVDKETADAVGHDRDVTFGAHISMWTAQGTMQPGWLASQTDMLSEDWQIVAD